MKLKNKVAIITGGSRGIGLATAKAFLKEGATVVIAASSPETAQKAVFSLQEEFPNSQVAGISPNLASLENVTKAFNDVVAQYGSLDILVNNAGVSESTPFANYTRRLSIR